MPGRAANLPSGTERLTRRELEIAALVAEGLTNREIAARLFISERTAEGHVERIRTKLGVRSRTQIATWVAESAGSRGDAYTTPAVAGSAPTTGEVALPGPPDGSVTAAPAPTRARRAQHRRPRRRTLAVVAAFVTVAAAAAVTGMALSRGTSTPGATITTIAGTGARQFSADGRPATATDLSLPIAAIADSAGHVYFIDANRVREVTDSGTVRTVAGTGEVGYGGDGGPATQAALSAPQALAIDSSGNLYIADARNNRVRRVDARGVITTFAGTGAAGYGGDGATASRAVLNQPAGLAIGFDDQLYIADTGNDRVREVRTDGTIVTVAGTGDDGYAGDGGPATSALMRSPRGLAFDAEGDLYVDDALNDRVRRIDLTGRISTIAGTGEEGYSGDGQPAIAAQLRLNLATVDASGSALAVDSRGDVYIADTANQRIRRVDVDGIITTVVGGDPGFGGDGGDATRARLQMPLSVSVAPDGDLIIADTGNDRIREVLMGTG